MNFINTLRYCPRFLSVLGGLSLTHQYLTVTNRSFSLLLTVGVSVSSQSVENENQSTLNISHKALWTQNIQRSSDSSSICSSQLSSSEELENEVEVRPEYKIYGESAWKDVPCEKVEKIPNNVKYVEQSASQNLSIVGSMLHFRATRLIYFMLEFINAQQKS